MKLGVFTVCMPDYEPFQALEKLKEFGYDGVEWRCVVDKGDPAKPGFWSGNRTTMSAQTILERADQLKSRCQQLGLEMPSLATYVDCTDPEAVDLHLRAAAAIGAKTARIGSPGYRPGAESYAEQFQKAKRQFVKVAELARKHKVRAAVETHPGLITPSVAGIRALIDGLDPKDVGIMWDPANGACEGLETYQMALDIAGPYLAELHAKNGRWVVSGQSNGHMQWRFESCPLREGQVDWPVVIGELKKAKYDGWLMFEDFSTLYPLDARLRENAQYFRGLIA